MTSTKAGTDRGYPGLRKMKTTRDSQPVQNSDDGCVSVIVTTNNGLTMSASNTLYLPACASCVMEGLILLW